MSNKRDHVMQLLAAHLPAAGYEAEAVTRCVAMVEEVYRQVPLRETKARAPTKEGGDTAFDAFWAKYPKNGGSKKAAQRAWTGATALADADIIQAGLDRHLRSKRWKSCIAKDEPEFIPHASTWLNRCQWETEVEAAPGAYTDTQYVEDDGTL